MKNRLLASYKNGNYTVKLYEDGTKIKETDFDEFEAEFPDSIDLKITNYCDLNCPMCHEMSSTSGVDGDLNSKFLSTLKQGTELAIGGGNPLAHNGLISFLKRMSKQGVVCNLTINEKHLLQNRELMEDLIAKKLIYGIGISLNEINDYTIQFAITHKNTVLHIINGIFTDFEKIANKDLKILILGYKKFGRGKVYYNNDIEVNMKKTKHILPTLFNKFACVSFDNLALKQLDVDKLLSPKEWKEFYMGDDGEATMYVDLVGAKCARSSTSEVRYGIEDNIIDMFNKVKK